MNSLPGGRVVSFRHLVSFFHVNSFIGSVRKKFSLWSFGITLTTTCTTKTKITIDGDVFPELRYCVGIEERQTARKRNYTAEPSI